MPDVELLKYPSREGASSLQDQEDRQTVCPSRRRSCALVNTPSPCVNKAVCHIQELKGKLESWLQLVKHVLNGHITHLRSEGKHLNNNMLGLTSGDGKEDDLPKELCIEGIGLLGDPSNGMNTLRKEAMDILMEVAYLIDRLEADRQEAKEALLKEKQTRERLRKKMDSLTLWRQQEFPVVIQNEHEACMRDIRELNWHLIRKKGKLEQVKDKVTHTQVLHLRLNEDIDFVKKHGPLVKEKLVMETDIMNKIRAAQIEADESFAKATKNLLNFECELKKEEDDFQMQKKEFVQELAKLQLHRKEQQEKYEELKSLWVGLSEKVKNTEEAITKMDDVFKSLSQQIPELEKQEDIYNDKVMALKMEIEMEVANTDHIKKCKADLQKHISESRQAGETKVAELENHLCQRRKELMALQEESKELELEIEDYTKKIHQSEQAIKQLQVDMRRIQLKIGQNEDARTKTQTQLSQVMALHCSTKAKLEDLEHLTFTEEQSNRKVTKNLKKKIMVEMKDIAILKGKISAAKVEFNEKKERADNEMKELQSEFEKASSTTAALEIVVKELRKIYSDKTEQTKNLKDELANLQMVKQNCSNELQAKRNAKLQSLNAVRELHNNVSERYEDAKSRITELRSISVEYREESDMMERTAKFLPAIIEELQSICDGIQYKHEMALTVMTSLQQDITSCENRTIDTTEAHDVHFKERRAVMQKMKADLREALKENVRLANEYRVLQKVLISAKREAVFVFDEKNRAEVSFQERKQLSLLQKRMHKAMVKYFNHRSLHSQAELAYFQSLSNANNQKITTVQEELSKAIQRLSAFLHSLTDDSTTTGDDANKQSGPDANGLSSAIQAVQIAV
ncbi:coiled-coil domain-containing protein 178 isoform X3 [Alosa sapidissima]|uniref:coiled-coil domain-containing protein 178 isoform X3 n=1 Tax=Alosa sapidissima TaxID=34773 RepID=UPI001C0A5BCE|nr:coiled-coil domain-containing protein 178 isoform X3 [Alosa sapidissima]